MPKETDPNPQITFRLAAAKVQEARAVMAQRGITNLSDFVRQAVIKEIARIEKEMAIETAQMELAKEAKLPGWMNDLLPRHEAAEKSQSPYNSKSSKKQTG